MANYWFSGLGGQQHSSILAGWNDIDAIRIWKVFFMIVVGSHLIFPPIKFQRIWITRARDMAKYWVVLLVDVVDSPQALVWMKCHYYHQNLSKSSRNCLFLPPTKFHLILPSRTPDMGKILRSVWAGLHDRFWLLFCGQTLNLKTADLGLTLFMNIVGLFLSFLSI